MGKLLYPLLLDPEEKIPYGAEGVGVFHPQEHVVRPLGHHRYQWIQCRRGKGVLFIGGARYTVGEGQGMLLFPRYPYERHEYYAVEGEWSTDWVIFQGRGIGDFIENTMGIRDSKVLYISSPVRIAEKIEELYSAAKQGIASANQCSLLVYDILLDLKAMTSESEKSAHIDRMRRLEPVIDYINENCTSPLTLGELAEIAGVSEQYLCAMFRDAMSKTVFEYVSIARIRRSKELLLQKSGMRIREVAARSGFGSESYFCSIFRRYEKMTPTEFRSMSNDAGQECENTDTNLKIL